jgi:ribose 5-phosphate isomerase B
MKIGITSDHRGYDLKELIKKEFKRDDVELIDYGTDSEE